MGATEDEAGKLFFFSFGLGPVTISWLLTKFLVSGRPCVMMCPQRSMPVSIMTQTCLLSAQVWSAPGWLHKLLMPYVAKTPLAEFIDIRFTEPLSETVSIDRWNSWVFEPSIDAFLNGEKSYKSQYIYGGLSANRITEEWKIRLRLNYNYSINEFEIEFAVTINFHGRKHE